MITIDKGINLPISGALTDSTIHQVNPTCDFAVLGDDYLGLKPTMKVAEGDSVKEGQALFEDKKNPGVVITSPVSGKIKQIIRGERRKLISVVISPDSSVPPQDFKKCGLEQISQIDKAAIIQQMQISGSWAYLRQRPFNKIPRLDATPHSIFVNTIDSNPLSFDPLLALENRTNDYLAGLEVLLRLTNGNVNVCHLEGRMLPATKNPRIKYHAFGGIHPVGLVGTHIHFIDAVGANKFVWHISLQDLIALGHLFLTARLDNFRLVSVAGNGVKKPQLVRTRRGVNLTSLLEGNLAEGKQRIISGSVFAGAKADKEIGNDFLGAYDQQVSVIPEGGESRFLGWAMPGMDLYSKTQTVIGRFLQGTKYAKPLRFDTSVYGEARAIFPFGNYEEVMPLDILPALLLRALAIKDTDTAIALGALELAEEDIALLSFVDVGKHDFGAILRENLTQIEKEG